ncbi:glutathione S-transferase family protein [Moraxella canis]|uniref:Glutathione S-transferase family protein n=1 Tax=Moraxella canis TaxID=90239 RepID=A0ABZ0WVG2_9GAMM|nr:glutathione S-transferase family protein [Moraxella canis]WQE03223.1 glutathione S-transferase family protein [Moraxella canis]
MKLYYAPGTCAMACWIALEWAGADYTVQKVDPHSDEYTKINPLAQVPAVDIDGRIFGQAGAILQYIVDTYPQADLGAGADPLDKFEFDEVMSFLSSDLHPAFWPYFGPQRYTTGESDADIAKAKEASYARIDRAMTHLDKLIGDGTHVFQDKKTVADALAFVMVRWSRNLEKSWEAYPNIARFMHAMNDDEATQYVLKNA